MDMKKLVLLFNAHAGKSTISQGIGEIADAFYKGGFEATVVPTQSKGFCRDYISQRGAEFDSVVVSGGDGTLSEAVNGIMAIKENRPKLGYIPSGTTNDFAVSAGIDTDFVSAAKTVADGHTKKIDIGQFNDKFFSYIAAFGAFTEVAYDTPQQSKNIFGHAAYILEGIKRLPYIKPYKVHAMADNVTVEGNFLFGMVSNTVSVGGIKALAEANVDLNDGLFEVILVRNPETPIELNQLLFDLANKHSDSKFYFNTRAAKVEITTEEVIPWTLDGEFGGECNYACIENRHSAIDLYCNENC